MSLPDDALATSPAQWLRQGQDAEAHGDLSTAIRDFDRAISILRTQPASATGRELGIAWMNRGNALQKQNTSQSIADAVRSYDHAVALLGESARDTDTANSLGAAWMNRGHAWQRLGTPEALKDAVASYDHALTLLTALPLDTNRAYRINLAATAMNRASALLAFPLPQAAAARESSDVALLVTFGAERHDPFMAEISLKARHARCAALAHLLAGAQTPAIAASLVTETGDCVDEALALIRHWEQRGVRNFRSLAVALYRFGAQFYLAHQPKFLAEFLLEILDPARNPGAIVDNEELHIIGAETIGRALADTYNQNLAMPTGEQSADLAQLRLELTAAEVRRASLASVRK